MDKFIVLVLCLYHALGKVDAVEVNDLQLKLASVVFRHGDRSPYATFPTDNYTKSDWPQGLGQLSILGMQHQYQLGLLFRDRYSSKDDLCSGLICANYSRVQVRVRSTDVDRCLQSVESQLSAFFPPDEDQTFNETLPWQPIPIHTIPTDLDSLLRPTDNCPNYDKLIEQDIQSPEYKKMEEDNKEFFEFLSDKTGMTVDLSNVVVIADIVIVENLYPGFYPPKWANETVLMKLEELNNWNVTMSFNTKEKNILSAGVWLEKVLSDMKGRKDPQGNETLEDMRLYLYSAHDTTVAAMSSALQVFNDQSPGYATALTVELYSDSSESQYYVKLFRRDGPFSTTFDPLTMPYCKNTSLCTLEEFEEFVTPLIPDDIAEACGRVSPVPSTSDTLMRYLVIALGCVCGLFLIIIIILILVLMSVCFKHRRSTEFSRLPISDT